MNSTKKNFNLALTGLFSALCIVLSITPLGYIKLGPISITIIHILVILAAILGGFGPAIITGLVFGLTSCIHSAMLGTPFFNNPLVSVMPRVLFAATVWAIYAGLSKLSFIKKPISGAITAAVGTFIHTLYVMTMLFLVFSTSAEYSNFIGKIGVEIIGFSPESLKGYFIMLGTMYATNGIWEIIGAAVVTFAVLGTIYITANQKSKLSKEEDEE